MSTPNRSVKVPEPEYRILAEKAKLTGRQIQWLLAKAIQRAYGKKP